mmetsp:Transcript_22418/g.32688  ORF Transcript_22418/g.32688 Transcript_22418/m.32688 type:complete len:714 (+) Transcript_22418:111-2252(+)|eukprot:CAMPEP_0185020230 /NCGR_PEP_ID=MMETSP1103-20130426/2824_1 /TAXON_ID=36769 /ORGANISM="Paraphysomonas bandaiensis, Strain Caron Lab Isolate" /LENGTH=713 /DNA_ID=CAMNT_0027551001 /DNA_START=84 /DNA_END=2225 /DNA_ORIENTATION=-
MDRSRIVALLFESLPEASEGDPIDIMDGLIMQLISQTEGSHKRPRTKESVIASLPVLSAGPSLLLNEDKNSCTICLENFITGDEVTHLPCEHYFHLREKAGECNGIISWLKQSNECPLCRYQLEAEEKRSVLDMSLPWVCPGCDHANPGDLLRARNARCTCRVTRAVVLLVERSPYLEDVTTRCADIYRRVVALHSASNLNETEKEVEQTAIQNLIEELASCDSLTTLESQHWVVKDHTIAFMRALLAGEPQFPIVILCPNSRAVLRSIHIKLNSLGLSSFHFHTRKTSSSIDSREEEESSSAKRLRRDEGRMFPVLEHVVKFIDRNFEVFDEIGMLAAGRVVSSPPSTYLWNSVGEVLIPQLSRGKWNLEDAYAMIGRGERDLVTLTASLGIDVGSAALVELMLERVLVQEGKELPVYKSVLSSGSDGKYAVLSSLIGPWICPGCDASNTDIKDCACGVERKVLRKVETSAELLALVKKIQTVYSQVVQTVVNAEDISAATTAIDVLESCREMKEQEDAGWSIRAHVISMLRCMLTGEKSYPIFGLDVNTRALLRHIHRQLVGLPNSEAEASLGFKLHLGPTNTFSPPLCSSSRINSFLSRHSTLVDEISGLVVYTSTESRWRVVTEGALPMFEDSGWKLLRAVEQLRSGKRNLDELTRGIDRNSKAIVEAILICVKRKEEEKFAVERSASGISAPSPGKSVDRKRKRQRED